MLDSPESPFLCKPYPHTRKLRLSEGAWGLGRGAGNGSPESFPLPTLTSRNRWPPTTLGATVTPTSLRMAI